MKKYSIIFVFFLISVYFCQFSLTTTPPSTSVDKNPKTRFENDVEWGELLEDWTIGSHKRKKRVMRPDSEEQSMVLVKEDLININNTKMNNFYHGGGDERESKIHNTKIINTNRISSNNNNNQNLNKPPKQVSETDLYLLSAIEKLVYKTDFMEKRLRRVEEMLYFVMAGNRIDQDPCPDNFTRVGMNCYYFAVSAGREYDWKAASKHCKKLGAVFAEFETIQESQDIVTHLQSSPYYKGKDFWIGGLNPGLLWIWSNSARPITATTTTTNDKISNKPPNQTFHISGDGRCLKLSYNPALRSYAYKGSDCSFRNNYICELPENSSSNEIRRIGKNMNILRDEL